MRLQTHFTSANEELVALVNKGYNLISAIQDDYLHRKEDGTYDDSRDVQNLFEPFNDWADEVEESLVRIFPTQLEKNVFLDTELPEHVLSMSGIPEKYLNTKRICACYVRSLNKIRQQNLPEYTDLPLDTRLYVENIDSFHKVRDVNPAIVMDMLTEGYLDRSEDSIQTALERVLSVSFHKKDWGGEQNDLYTANVIINGVRHETAFLLKGNGLRKKTMEIRDCGANGDQILRLCRSPAKLFVVQFVGQISEAIISDIDGKVRQMRSEGKDAWYCIMDGQDTARVLHAYGEL